MGLWAFLKSVFSCFGVKGVLAFGFYRTGGLEFWSFDVLEF